MTGRFVCRLQLLNRMAHWRPLPLLYNSFLHHSGLYMRKTNPSLHVLQGCTVTTVTSEVPVIRKKESFESTKSMSDIPPRNKISLSFYRNGDMGHLGNFKARHRIHDYPWLLVIPNGHVLYKENWYEFKSTGNDLVNKINNLTSESVVKSEYNSIQIVVDLYHSFFQKCTQQKCEESFLWLKRIEQILCSSLNECCNDQQVVNVSMLKDLFEILEASAAKGLPCQDLYNAVFLKLNKWKKIGSKEVLRALSIQMIYEKKSTKLEAEILMDCLCHHHELSIAEVGFLLRGLVPYKYTIPSIPEKTFTDLLIRICSEKCAESLLVIQDCLHLFQLVRFMRVYRHRGHSRAVIVFLQHINGILEISNQDKLSHVAVDVCCVMEIVKILFVPFAKSITDKLRRIDLIDQKQGNFAVLIKSLGLLQFDVNNKGMYDDIVHLVMNNKKGIEEQPLVHHIMLMTGFAYLDIFPLSLWDSLSKKLCSLDETYLWNLPSKYLISLNVLDVVKEIEYQKESQIGLPKHVKKFIHQQQGKHMMIREKTHNARHLHFIDACFEDLKVELGNHCVHCHFILPGFKFPDIEFRLDDNDKPLAFNPVDYSQILRNNYWHENPAHKKLVIMCVRSYEDIVLEVNSDVSQINWNDMKLNGRVSMKKRLLQRLGYTVHVLKNINGVVKDAQYM